MFTNDNTIPDNIAEWCMKQEMFWVATSPLSGTGHINLSPKGLKGTFHIIDSKKVWYEDLTGSGESGAMAIVLGNIPNLLVWS